MNFDPQYPSNNLKYLDRVFCKDVNLRNLISCETRGFLSDLMSKLFGKKQKKQNIWPPLPRHNSVNRRNALLLRNAQASNQQVTNYVKNTGSILT